LEDHSSQLVGIILPGLVSFSFIAPFQYDVSFYRFKMEYPSFNEVYTLCSIQAAKAQVVPVVCLRIPLISQG